MTMKMELKLLIITLYFVSSSFAKDDVTHILVKDDVTHNVDETRENRAFEELKEFVATRMKHMATEHANEIQGLKNLIDIQERQVLKLQSDNLEFVSVIHKLEKEIEEMKTNGLKVECACNSDNRSTKESVDLANTDNDYERPKSAPNLRSSTLKERNGRQSRMRRTVVGTKVAFFASITNTVLHLGQYEDIVFDQAVTNIGNAYDEHHGTFVAPVGGTYVFSVTLLPRSESPNTWGHFVVKGGVVAKLALQPGHTASQTIVVNLTTGDDVSVQNTVADRAFIGDRYCTFSGFLLNEDFANNLVG